MIEKIYERFKVTLTVIAIALIIVLAWGMSWLIIQIITDFSRVVSIYKDNAIFINATLIVVTLAILLTIDYFRYNRKVKLHREAHFRHSIYNWDKNDQVELYKKHGDVYLNYVMIQFPEKFGALKERLFNEESVEITDDK